MLTSQGLRVAQLTDEGFLIKGSENFLSIFKCIKKSYISGDEELLMYFIQTLHENKYLYPIILSNEEEEYYPIRELYVDLLKLSLIDDKEELFLFIWNLIDKEEDISSLSLYILSKRRKLNRARMAILEGLSNYIKKEWLSYAILSEDVDIITSFLLEQEDLNLIYTLLEIYPSLRIEELLDLTSCKRIEVEDIKIEYIVKRPKFRQLKRMYTCNAFPRELAEGNRCKLRLKLLSRDVTQKEMNSLSGYIDCYDISIEDLITSLCRFTVPELTTGEYIIPNNLPQLIGQPSDFIFGYL